MKIRKGYGIGKGMGYKNLMPMDAHIHSLSAKGQKTKYNVTAVALNRKTKKQIGKARTELIDVKKNQLFKDVKNKEDVKETYEAFWDINPYSEEVVKVIDINAKAKKIGKKYYKKVELFSDFTDMEVSDVKEILKSEGAMIKPLPKVDLGNLTLKNLNIDYILPIEYEIRHKDGSGSFPIMWNPNQKIKLKKGDKFIVESIGREEGLIRYAHGLKSEWKDNTDKELRERSFLGSKISARRDDELLRRKVTK